MKPKIFVAQTTDNFSNFVSSALLENKLPVLVTTDESTADYIIVSGGVKGQNKWYDTVFGVEKDRNQGSMRLIRVYDKVVVWAASSGDKSFWLAEFKSMGPAKVANRLARKLKDDLPKLSLEANTRKPGDLCGGSAEKCNAKGVEVFNLQKFADAEAAFREATRLDSSNAAYHHNLGSALNAQGKFEAAFVAIELAVRLAPNESVYKASLEAVRSNRTR